MKRFMKLFISVSLIVLLMSGCQSTEKVLKLKYDEYNVELGNKIVEEAICYLDLTELTDDEINSIREKSQVTIDAQDSTNQIKPEIYEKVGTYEAKIQYLNETLEFNINVVDDQQPTILGPSVIAVEQGNSDFNFQNDYSCYAFYGNCHILVDTSQVNFDEPGDYPATISAMQGSTLKNVRDITVKIQKKVTNQIPSHIVLDVPYYNQMENGAPNGCEATSLYMALKYKNKIDTDIRTFIGSVPKADTPYVGFSGDPFSSSQQMNDYYTIFPQALIKATHQYAKMRDISGGDIYQIIDELANDYPVVVWATGGLRPAVKKDFYFGNVTSNLHIVLVNGYDLDKKVFYIKDPADKELEEVSFEQFQSAYDAMKYAIAVEG